MAAQATDTRQWIQISSPSELKFATAGEGAKSNLVPMYQITDQRYSVYWQTGSSKQKI
jgi:hypothetical protein